MLAATREGAVRDGASSALSTTPGTRSPGSPPRATPHARRAPPLARSFGSGVTFFESVALPDPGLRPQGLSLGADGTLWAAFSFYGEDGTPRRVVARHPARGPGAWSAPTPIPGEGWIIAHRPRSIQRQRAGPRHGGQRSPSDPPPRDGRTMVVDPLPGPAPALVRDAALDAAGDLHITFAWTAAEQRLGYVHGSFAPSSHR